MQRVVSGLAFGQTINPLPTRVVPAAPSGGYLLDATFADTTLRYAYSLRKIKTYAGPLLRVRRNSDNATLDVFADANGLLDTTALLAFAGAGDAFVAIWYDQSGNANHALQTSTTSQPLLVQNGQIVTGFKGDGTSSNLPAMGFYLNSQYQFLQLDTVWLGSNFSFCMAGNRKQNAPAYGRWISIFDNNAGNDSGQGAGLLPLLSLGDNLASWQAGGKVSAAYPNGGAGQSVSNGDVGFCACSRFSASQTKILAGNNAASGSGIGNVSASTLRVGNADDATGDGFFGGRMYEQFAFLGTLSDADTATIAFNQRTFWGVI